MYLGLEAIVEKRSTQTEMSVARWSSEANLWATTACVGQHKEWHGEPCEVLWLAHGGGDTRGRRYRQVRDGGVAFLALSRPGGAYLDVGVASKQASRKVKFREIPFS